MNVRIKQILEQISALEDELETVVAEQQEYIRYQIEGRRIVFGQAMRDAHLKARMGLYRWFRGVRPQNYLTAPIIYGMIVPMVLFDLCVSIYQYTCFPIYRVARVSRSRYMVMDHRHLDYLNIIEKIDCMYCSYAVGLLGYAQEITARTQQYFCPIKHARKMLNIHSRYESFIDYGEEAGFHDKLEAFRARLAKEAEQQES